MSYLEQLIAKLRKAKIVIGIRELREVTNLLDQQKEISRRYLKSFRGDLYPVDCFELDGVSECINPDTCVTKYVWKRISDSINDVVDGIMLSELVSESKKVNIELDSEAKIGKNKAKC